MGIAAKLGADPSQKRRVAKKVQNLMVQTLVHRVVYGRGGLERKKAIHIGCRV